jgi:glucuronosyltransferase
MEFSSAIKTHVLLYLWKLWKVVVLPTDSSHWINEKTILDELVQRAHEVTVLATSASILIDSNKVCTIKSEV